MIKRKKKKLAAEKEAQLIAAEVKANTESSPTKISRDVSTYTIDTEQSPSSVSGIRQTDSPKSQSRNSTGSNFARMASQEREKMNSQGVMVKSNSMKNASAGSKNVSNANSPMKRAMASQFANQSYSNEKQRDSGGDSTNGSIKAMNGKPRGSANGKVTVSNVYSKNGEMEQPKVLQYQISKKSLK